MTCTRCPNEPLRERAKIAAEMLAAASSVSDPAVRALYLAGARIAIVQVENEVSILRRSLERMEAEAARVGYQPKEPE
jgi:hypothetical protein